MNQIADMAYETETAATPDSPYGRNSTGILPSHVLRRLIAARREVLAADDIAEVQIQPASLDLRLAGTAYRIRASFLPGETARVADKLSSMVIHEIDPKDKAAAFGAVARALKPGGQFVIFDETYPTTDAELRTTPARFARTRRASGSWSSRRRFDELKYNRAP